MYVIIYKMDRKESKDMKTINFVIPCYNEEGNIELFYDEVKKIVNNLNYEFTYTFVNDGSSDKTFDELKNLANKDHAVKVINFSRNFGKEAAILAGLDYSTQYDASILIDADLEMPLKYAVMMIEYWENGKKLVTTYRDNRRGGIKNNLAKKFYLVYNKLSDSAIEEEALDFQLMDKEIVKEIVKFREYNRFFKGITGYIGYDREVMGISTEVRQNGSSSFGSFSRLFSYAFKGIAVHSTVLLAMSAILGMIMSGIGLLYFIYIVIDKILFSSAVAGWSSLMSIMLIFFGVVLIILGIMGYYIGLIYTEVKHRPIYLVQDEINMEDKC